MRGYFCFFRMGLSVEKHFGQRVRHDVEPFYIANLNVVVTGTDPNKLLSLILNSFLCDFRCHYLAKVLNI